MVAEVISGLPLPAMKRRGAPPKYPWLQLKPGDAFKFAADVSYAGARSMASQMVAGHKIKLAVRQCIDGIYCWRIDGTQWELVNGNYGQPVDTIQDYGHTTEEIASHTTVMGTGTLAEPPQPMFPVPKISDGERRVQEIIAERRAARTARGEHDDM